MRTTGEAERLCRPADREAPGPPASVTRRVVAGAGLEDDLVMSAEEYDTVKAALAAVTKNGAGAQANSWLLLPSQVRATRQSELDGIDLRFHRATIQGRHLKRARWTRRTSVGPYSLMGPQRTAPVAR